MAKPRVVIVTGANRGIGLEICRQILIKHAPLKLYACSRTGKNLGLQPNDSSSTIIYPTLDITNTCQIETLVNRIRSEDDHVDVLINNAGTNSYANDAKEADEIIRVNYTGTLNMCRAFLPLLLSSCNNNNDDSSAPRIVNVSSGASSLQQYSPQIQSQFRDPNITTSKISTLIADYLSAVKSNDVDGWGDTRGYRFSKACVNALTGLLARDNPGIVINCCCPGWVDTDMGNIRGQPSKTVEEGARIPVRLAFANDLGGISGKYWANEGVSDIGYGEVQEW